MEKTAIAKLISDLNKLDNKSFAFTPKDVIKMLEKSLQKEEKQIKAAFDAGMGYMSDEFKNFDYPSATYYSSMYVS